MFSRVKKFRFFGFFSLIIILFSWADSIYAEEYSLDDLYRIALERSERIKISEEDLFISEMGKDKAMSVLLPKLTAFGNYTRYTEDKYSSTGSVIQPDTSVSWGVRLDQSFSLSARELTALRISKENIEKNIYDLRTTREEHLLNVSVAYFDVLKSKRAVEIAKANVERLTKHRDAAAVRLRVGEVTKTTLLRAEAELSGAQSEEIRAQNRLNLTKAILSRLVGIEGDYGIKESSADSLATYIIDMESLESLKQLALSERAELKSLKLQENIGEDQVKYARGSYWPTVSVEGVFLRKDDDPANTVFFNKESIYGMVKISFPFFEGGLRRAEVREAESKHRQATLFYEDAKRSILIEVENAYLDVKTQKGITEKFEAQVIYAQDNYNAVSKQFEFGLVNSIDVMDANTLLVTSERQLAEARYNYQLSLLRMQRATGTLLKTAMSQIKQDER